MVGQNLLGSDKVSYMQRHTLISVHNISTHTGNVLFIYKEYCPSKTMNIRHWEKSGQSIIFHKWCNFFIKGHSDLHFSPASCFGLDAICSCFSF